MPGDFQPSSFIPKKTLINTSSGSAPKQINIFMLIAGIIFVISLVGAGAAFMYERISQSELTRLQASLDRVKESFEPRTISTLSRTDLRLDVASKLLEEHVTVSPFFDLLSTMTLKTVKFNNFDFSRGVDGTLSVVMDGTAESYRSIALQSETFGDNEHIQGPVFSDFILDDSGNVTFKVGFTISKDFLAYSNSF
ncbi:hypothetical protein COW81_02615 [Candidatus Campbellbacteria bacterium CG22_combo_CG10-13_8_21_14_all_36_13]|uniref:Uncharacterized protein n=1 Tax=Candidatus Campbellbacteria bacterium CG22_combo_CG10-13_8_21_14_all_36_13 TaxID=1974529 RepID=A0A2H0DYC0_9BACT|nr:MAG: hypothetical protein COW81_02615 [Candidatus Campbellbacteria bacterium CG22_combo_CG10-13_8_21_14_all_36_13]